ncbi:MAG: polynucleotide adenylyltransferase PcnB [Tepidimonas sp.]|uniref:polynucleotide adenylyltransferase PcnB n=1 Tax=Tepidimonas sp. TaxID=2002775 RepID=UPI00259F4B6E|nr:polynucleotide adenylyltransferase PcnB [Tepidimonas sp.]MDM7455714.1 polynucleotide adenylyltransferase PcnB [Tepidimonas sp.]
MIKTLIDKLLDKTVRPTLRRPRFGKREDVPVAVHGIDPSLVDGRALDVVHTLKRAGFQAYIVGGAVRDLLLGLRPKDFDVATNATPDQVKALFRRAFIIGRRFRIVHVVFGRGREHEVIEVSTFRAYLDSAAAEPVVGDERSQRALAGVSLAVDASGRVLRDNVWGPIEQDAARRDFTINAMYYDPETETVVDFHQGIRDARKRLLRMIGDPSTRYREDPVRIIRAVRFAAKLSALGFKLDDKTRAPMVAHLPLLADVPPSRLFDEMLKLLQTGHAIASVEALKANGLARGIYPLLDVVVERGEDPFVRAALQDTDRRVAEGKPVAPSFLLACVLWQDVRTAWQRRLGEGVAPFPALVEAVDTVFESRIGDISGRGKLGADLREIWMMQPRFDKRSGQSPFTLVEQPRFRAGFDFLRLRAQVGEVEEELAHWWETFSLAGEAVRRDMMEAIRLEQQRAKAPGKAARSRRQRASDTAGDEGLPPARCAVSDPAMPSPEDLSGEPPGPAAPRKRRRRRRKPAGGGAGAEDGVRPSDGGTPDA